MTSGHTVVSVFRVFVYLADICSIKEKQLIVFVDSDRIHSSKSALSSRKCVSISEVDCFLRLKEFSDKLDTDIHTCDYFQHYIVTFINIWKIDISIIKLTLKI